jgi:myo-inositol 2-dehydrogenase/D-chiro-inositol 1-dehydrogenase
VVATTVRSATASGFQSDAALPFFLERYAAAYRAELDAFVQALLGEGPAGPNGEDGLRALLLANAAVEAAKTGRTVRPSEV